ncbi:hypothetical protein QL285_014765 [Trifolium repens]|nr:hypothetical protein QL285_014765 [Trifolium repens]
MWKMWCTRPQQNYLQATSTTCSNSTTCYNSTPPPLGSNPTPPHAAANPAPPPPAANPTPPPPTAVAITQHQPLAIATRKSPIDRNKTQASTQPPIVTRKSPIKRNKT